MKKDLCLKVMIAVLAVLGISIILNNKKEGFLNLTPGVYFLKVIQKVYYIQHIK